MDTRTFIQEYIKFLKENADAERAKKEKQYLYSDLKHYGVSVEDRRGYLLPYKKQLLSLTKKDALKLVEALWNTPSHEERCGALHVLNLHKEKLDLDDIPLIEKMMRESKGWAFLDSLVIPIMPGIIKKNKSAFDLLKRWITDNDFWVRRSALLSQLLFFRTGQGGNKNLFFDFAESQFDESWIDKRYIDKEERKRARFFIRKAIGWTLREMSAQDPEAVFEFLKKHRAEMAGLSFREGSRKLPKRFKDKL